MREGSREEEVSKQNGPVTAETGVPKAQGWGRAEHTVEDANVTRPAHLGKAMV